MGRTDPALPSFCVLLVQVPPPDLAFSKNFGDKKQNLYLLPPPAPWELGGPAVGTGGRWGPGGSGQHTAAERPAFAWASLEVPQARLGALWPRCVRRPCAGTALLMGAGVH